MDEHKKAVSVSVEYSTPWFDLVSKRVAGQPEPYYALRMADYVCVVAITARRELVLVRQYRPAVERYTLELPAGHVESDQTPEEAARCELAEETGFAPPAFELLGTLFSDTGRHENRMWCYLADAVQPLGPSHTTEAGLETVFVPLAEVNQMVSRGEFDHALHIAALMLATLRRLPT